MKWSALASMLMIALASVASQAQQSPLFDSEAEVRVAAAEDGWPSEGADAKATTFAVRVTLGGWVF